MPKYSSYMELDVWKKARDLAREIYLVTVGFPNSELYGLASQMRRAAVSIPSNIAEGCGRQYKKETIQFLFMARGSQYELETELYISYDVGLINKEVLEKKLELLIECRKLLSGYISYVATSKLR